MVRTAVCSVQNGRAYMEDRYTICKNLLPHLHMFAVYDGHGGHQVADTCAMHLPDYLKNGLTGCSTRDGIDISSVSNDSYESDDSTMESHASAADASRTTTTTTASATTALKYALKATDERAWRTVRGLSTRSSSSSVTTAEGRKTRSQGFSLSSSSDEQCGSTACIAVVEPHEITLANVGDSRAILKSASGRVRQLSFDHKPGSERERTRIERAGGAVVDVFGVARVMGVLSLSRALGDWHLRPFVSQDADLVSVKLDGNEEYMLIASDGLWDVMSNEDVVAVIDNLLKVRRRVELSTAAAAHAFVDKKKDLSLPSETPDGAEGADDAPHEGGPVPSAAAASAAKFKVQGISMARAVVEEAIRRKSADNITVMWIDLSPGSMLIDSKSVLRTAGKKS